MGTGNILQFMDSFGLDSVIICNDGTLRNYGYYTYFTGAYEPRRAILFITNENSPKAFIESFQPSDNNVLVKYPRGIDAMIVPGLSPWIEQFRVGEGYQSAAMIGCECISELLEPDSRLLDSTNVVVAHQALKRCILEMKRRKTPEDMRHLRHGYTLAGQGLHMYVKLVKELGPWKAQSRVNEWLISQGASLVIIHCGDEIGRPTIDKYSIPIRDNPQRDGNQQLLFALVELATSTGHWVELGCTILSSDVTERQRAKIHHLQSEFDDIVRRLSPGFLCSEFSASAIRIAEELDASIEGRLGHGTGIDEDLPSINLASNDELVRGDVFCVHLILRDKLQGFLYGVADTFLMMPDGAVSFSQVM